MKTIAIITGASGGLGRAFTALLAADPSLDEIWAVARHREGLEALASAYPGQIRPYMADLSRREEIAALGEVLKGEDVSIRYLINNAGYAKFCGWDELSPMDSLAMLDLNIGGVVAMGLTCLPMMPPGSHLLNIASQASFQPLPWLNLYGASKAFVRFYSRALGMELRERGVTVTAVCPGWMDTGLFDRARVESAHAITRFVGRFTPEQVAEKALADARKGRALSIYGWYPRLHHLIAKLLPQRLMMQLWLMQQGMK